jgi:hypothetical protein
VNKVKVNRVYISANSRKKMTQDERNMLNDLANKIAQTAPPPKDQEAEDFIRTKIGSRPDALYLMTQTVLIQNLALHHAQQQIQDLQQRAGSPQVSSGGSFLGGAAPPPPRGGYAQPSQQQQYAPPPPQYSAPQQMPNPSGASSFLKGAAQTAAGVAAGGLALEAINSMFSHHGYGGGFGGFGGSYGGPAVEETVVNNYYDQPQQDDYRADDAGNYDDSANVDDSGQYDDSSYDSGDTGGGLDDGGGDNFV